MSALRERAAVPDDYPAFVRLWRELEIGATPPHVAHWVAQMQPSTWFLEADGGELVAYALVFPLGGRGDVRQIAVDAAWRRRGVGRQLMAAVAARLRAAGCRDWRLEVRRDNAAAIALYEAVGLRVLRAIRIVTIARTAIAQLAEPRAARFAAAVLTASDDAALEARYDLGGGELARWRTVRPDTTLWLLRDAGAIAGFARYCRVHEPGSALLFPFRATGAAAAAHLVTAAMSAPLPDRVELCVVDAAVADALLAVGGELTAEQLEMGGAL